MQQRGDVSTSKNIIRVHGTVIIITTTTCCYTTTTTTTTIFAVSSIYPKGQKQNLKAIKQKCLVLGVIIVIIIMVSLIGGLYSLTAF